MKLNTRELMLLWNLLQNFGCEAEHERAGALE